MHEIYESILPYDEAVGMIRSFSLTRDHTMRTFSGRGAADPLHRLPYFTNHIFRYKDENGDIVQDDVMLRTVFYRYALIHIPRTGGRYLYQNYAIWRENEDHVTFKRSNRCTCLRLVDVTPGYWNGTNLLSGTCAIARNPYDWLSSLYYHGEHGWADLRLLLREQGRDGFKEFIRAACDENDSGHIAMCNEVFPFQHGMSGQLWDDEDRLNVENILFFERLDESAKLLNLQKRTDKTTMAERDIFSSFVVAKNRPGYRELYDDEMISLVMHYFKRELDFFHYDFDGLHFPGNYLTLSGGRTHHSNLLKRVQNGR